jgi:hypothetical protein
MPKASAKASTKKSLIYRIGATVWAKATSISNDAELSRRFGIKAKDTWIPGIVLEAQLQLSKGGKRMKYVKARFYLGGTDTKEKSLAISAVRETPSSLPCRSLPMDLLSFQADGGILPPEEDDVSSVTQDPSLDCNTYTPVIFPPPASPLDPMTWAAMPVTPAVAFAATLTPASTAAAYASLVTPAVTAPAATTTSPAATGETTTPVATATTTQATATYNRVTVNSHGTSWQTDNGITCSIDCNGGYTDCSWSLKDNLRNTLSSGCDPSQKMSRLDYYFASYPSNALKTELSATNEQLSLHGLENIDIGDLIAFKGTTYLATRCAFTSRRQLWSYASHSKYLPPMAFGSFCGFSRDRYDAIFKHHRWSHQPETCPEGMSSEEYRWLLVEPFVDIVNDHREKFFKPSSVLCADESFSRWYGLGGDWINIGLPMYVAYDRKPEAGCEIQSACCGESGIMARLKLRKTKRANDAAEAATAAAAAAEEEDLDEDDLPPAAAEQQRNAGTKDLLDLIFPWARSGRVVVADSHFASVQTARELYKIGLRFIGCVKTATKGFPMKHLGGIQFPPGRGHHYGMYHKSTDPILPDLLAFTWCDRDRRCFISTCSHLRPAAPIERSRMRQVAPVETDEAPELQALSIPLPACAKLYYDNCGRIDQHNRKRQDDLELERKIGTHDWSKRVCFSVEAMLVVDAYLLYIGCTQPGLDAKHRETFDEFIHKLADEMIDWKDSNRRSTTTTLHTPAKRKAPPPSMENVVHLVPTAELRSDSSCSDGSKSSAKKPKYCKLPGCHHKSIQLCSHCNVHFCGPHTKGNRDCFQQHCNSHHPGMTVVTSSLI